MLFHLVKRFVIKFLRFIFLILLTTILVGQFDVARVYDGDILKAKGRDIEIKVRLVGIDAPETFKKREVRGHHLADKLRSH